MVLHKCPFDSFTLQALRVSAVTADTALVRASWTWVLAYDCIQLLGASWLESRLPNVESSISPLHAPRSVRVCIPLCSLIEPHYDT